MSLCEHETSPAGRVWVHVKLLPNDGFCLALHAGNLGRRGRSAFLRFGSQSFRAFGGGAFDLGLLLLPKANLLEESLVLSFEV